MTQASTAPVAAPRRYDWWWQLAAAVSLLSFLIFQLDHALAIPPLTDDAWIATVAKNFAFGYGWSTSTGRIMPFDADITTGPGLLLPLAAAIHAIGNTIWLPRVFTLLWHSLLLSLLLWRLHVILKRAHWWRLLTLLPLFYSSIHWQLWISSLGDVTAFLYTALGSVLLAEGLNRNIHDRKHWLFIISSATSLSLACLSKTVALVPASSVLLLPLLLSHRPLRNLVCLLLVFLLPLLLWQVYQHQAVTHLPAADRQLIKAKFTYNFIHTGSGIAALQEAWQNNQLWQHIADTTFHNFQRYSEITSNLLNPLPVFFTLFCISVVTMLLRCLLIKPKAVLQQVLLSLSLPTVAYLGWVICFGAVNFGRFITFDLLLGLTALSIALSWRTSLAIGTALGLLISLLLFPASSGLYGFFYKWQHIPSPEVQALQQVINILNSRYADDRLVTCSNSFSREVEYALPSVNRIEDCTLLLGNSIELDVNKALTDERYRPFFAAATDVPDSQAKRARIQKIFMDARNTSQLNVIAPVHWLSTPPNFIAVINPISVNFANFGPAANYRTVTNACRETLYDQGNFRLLRCNGADVRAAIEAHGGVEFIPQKWLDTLWLREASND